MTQQDRARRPPFRRADLTDEQRERDRLRRQELDKRRRWAKGVVPRAQSLMQRAPWEAEGCSRATWYRRHGETDALRTQETVSRQAEPHHEAFHTTDETVVLPVLPQAPPVQERRDPAPISIVERPYPPASTEPSDRAPTVTGTVSMDAWTIEECIDHYDERAAILEFDGGYDRDDAEARAYDEIVQALQWSRNDADFWQRLRTELDARRLARRNLGEGGRAA